MPDAPPHISRLTALPVRQFITAGDAGEEVPARSTFTPVFVDALRYGLGDLNGDGYITGKELGLHLYQEVPKHAEQHPQFGTIPNAYELSRGDLVLRAKTNAVSALSNGKICTADIWVPAQFEIKTKRVLIKEGYFDSIQDPPVFTKETIKVVTMPEHLQLLCGIEGVCYPPNGEVKKRVKMKINGPDRGEINADLYLLSERFEILEVERVEKESSAPENYVPPKYKDVVTQNIVEKGYFGQELVVCPEYYYSAVKLMQKKLKRLGIYKGPVDGIVGNMTMNSMQIYQEIKGLGRSRVLNLETVRSMGLSYR